MHSKNIPKQGLGHRLVVAPGDLLNEVLIKIVGDFIIGVNSGDQLVLLLSGYIKNSKGVLPPLAFNEVPYPFDRVEFTTLRRKKLTH